MATKLWISSLCFVHMVFALPGALERRAGCVSDNCLRQLEHSSALASPYCSSYLNGASAVITTITITTTIPAFTPPSLTLLGKRSASDHIGSSFSTSPPPLLTLIEQKLVKKATAFSPSACTEAPTAISSGCSCLLSTTVTAVATVIAGLPTQCNAANNYGLVTEGFAIEDGPGQANHYYAFNEPNKGACCAYCYSIPNCLAFSQGNYADGSVACNVWEIYTAPTTVQNSICPFGALTVSLTQPTPSGGAGVGPCGLPAISGTPVP